MYFVPTYVRICKDVELHFTDKKDLLHQDIAMAYFLSLFGSSPYVLNSSIR